MSSLTWADIYNEPVSPYQQPAPLSGGGPGQSFVAPMFGTMGLGSIIPSGPGPAFSVVGIIVALVALRVAIELSERS